MATTIFPDLPGLTWQGKRTPNWNSLTQTAASLLETRMALASYPVREWELNYGYLQNRPGKLHLQTLEGFFNSVAGGAYSFFLRDQDDNSTTNEIIGTGDGTTRTWQLQRNWGGFTEPVGGIDTRTSATYGPYTRPAAQAFQVYQGGSPVSVTSNADAGTITFGTAPGSGVIIRADFSYFWRVRFADDKLDFSRMMYQLFDCQGVRLKQARS